MAERELKIYIGLSRALNRINRASDAIFHRYGLTRGQFAVLEALYHKGDLSVGEVQEKILSTSGTIPVIVRNLQEEGLLEKKPDDFDKRKCILRITKKGRELMDRAYPENEALIKSMIGIWDALEQEQVLHCMRKFGGLPKGKKN